MPLTTLFKFVDDMNRNEWHISAFTYTYNKVRSVVSVETRECFTPSSGWVFCRIHFFDTIQPDRQLVSEVNDYGMTASLTDIRHYFKITYDPNSKPHDILEALYCHMNLHFPNTIRPMTEEENRCVDHLFIFHGENPYHNCFAVKHNPNNGQRRPENSDKARRYCRDIYDYFKADTNISFCFHEGDSATLEEILEHMAKEGSQRRH